ncbi:MAG: hypothetical protein IJG53_04570, partial [Eggerthellaceae bacterium]|nr:hypothetical protein [Eggerthellaceae bacterium]
MNTVLQSIITILPFAVLIVGMLVFKVDSLKITFVVFLLEVVICLVVYGMPLAGMFKAILWGIICLWTAFLVFWGGQLFGVAFRTTGLLKLMIGVIGHLVPSKEGRSFALVSIITSAVGAFNGYATFPVLIPGLKEMGYPGR